MAAEVGSVPVNGYGHSNAGSYTGDAYRHQTTASATSSQAGAPVAGSSSSQNSDISKEQVAWYFVESYYTTMSQTPEKLHLFFNKRSQLVSGVEEEKSSVASGQKAIKERLSELDFQDCKVRVTNVDSQSSDSTIVIQVIGEMSNKSQPHRKFVQTFVLASQTNGYFVLNDIFRYIKDDVDEEEAGAAEEAQEQEEQPVASETVHVEASGTEEEVKEEVLKQVEQKLEELTSEEKVPEAEKEEAPAAAVNGTPVPESADDAETEEAPAAAVSAPTEVKAEEIEAAVAQEDLEPEKPLDPAPTPKAEAPVAATPSAPPKPAVPRSWAQLAAGNQAKAAAAAAAAPAARQAPTASSQPKSAAAPAAATPTQSAQARETSPDSQKEGSQGGWQTAGQEHSRKQSRAQNAPAVGNDGRVRAFVKNVTEDVEADLLKSVLAKFGEIVYFDVARQKKAAFVEYKAVAGFNAAVAANPHRVGTEEVWVEERRIAGGGFARGGARGGRGGYEGRGGAPRGAYGPRGGRGSGNITPRGGRGGAQA